MKKEHRIAQALLLLGLAATIFTACNKNDFTPPGSGGNSPSAKLIQYGSDTSHIQFSYDMAGNIVKLDYVSNGLHMPYDVIYSNGAPAQMVTTNSNVNLTFDNGFLKKTDLYNNNGKDHQATSVFSYFNNRVSGQVYYQQTANALQQSIKYDYNYLDNGDLGFMSIFLWNVNTNQYDLVWTFKCDYDTHPNPLLQINNFYVQFYAVPASQHNITQLTIFDAHNAVKLTATYNYTYNQNGYPVAAERTLIQPGAGPEVNHIKFIYQ